MEREGFFAAKLVLVANADDSGGGSSSTRAPQLPQRSTRALTGGVSSNEHWGQVTVLRGDVENFRRHTPHTVSYTHLTLPTN